MRLLEWLGLLGYGKSAEEQACHIRYESVIQKRGGWGGGVIMDNLKIIFLISQQKHML